MQSLKYGSSFLVTGEEEVVVTNAVEVVSSSVLTVVDRFESNLSPLTLLCALSKWKTMDVDTTKPRG